MADIKDRVKGAIDTGIEQKDFWTRQQARPRTRPINWAMDPAPLSSKVGISWTP